jgi:hypothetical protein
MMRHCATEVWRYKTNEALFSALRLSLLVLSCNVRGGLIVKTEAVTKTALPKTSITSYPNKYNWHAAFHAEVNLDLFTNASKWVGTLFYVTFSVTRLYTFDDRLISE